MALEDDLFYACTSYCDALNHYKDVREEMLFRRSLSGYTHDERKKVIKYEKERLNNCIFILKEILNKIDSDKNE